MSLTPWGAMATQDRAQGIRIVAIWVTASENVLRNLKRRGVDDEAAIWRKIQHVDEFLLPEGRCQYKIEMRGGDGTDFPRFEQMVLQELASFSAT